jgi:hypothetical protein
LIGIKQNVQPVASANGTSSLASRRHEIRRRRHGLAHGLPSGARWGAVLLGAGWLLLAGILGYLNT